MKQLLIGSISILALLTGGIVLQSYKPIQNKTYLQNEVVCEDETYIDYTTGKSADCTDQSDLNNRVACIRLPVVCRDLKGRPITGYLEVHHDNNILANRQHFVNGKRDGIWELYYENGLKYWNVTYKDGYIDGPFERYSIEGTKIIEGYYTKGKVQKKYIYHDNGQLFEQEEFDPNLNGHITFYYPSGQISDVIPFKKGKPDGVRKTYFKDGNIAGETTYINGQRNGLEQKFYPNGQLAGKTTYQNDEPIGNAITYYDTGKVRMDIFMRVPRKIEQGKFYDETGHLAAEIYYDNDVLNVTKSRIYNETTKQYQSLEGCNLQQSCDPLFNAISNALDPEKNQTSQD